MFFWPKEVTWSQFTANQEEAKDTLNEQNIAFYLNKSYNFKALS